MKNFTSGFTLTESAVVIGVASLVLGAVWGAAGTVSQGNRVSSSSQLVGEVSQNIRAYYMNAAGIPLTGNCDITATLDANKIFPSSMRLCSGTEANARCSIVSPFSATSGTNTFRVFAPAPCANGTTASAYRIVLSGLKKDACADLLYSGMNYKDNSMGITGVCGGQNNVCAVSTSTAWEGVSCNSAGTNAGICGIGATPAPITLSQAQGHCTNSAAYNEVGWEFKLRN